MFLCESKFTDLAKKMQCQMKMRMHLEGTGALNLLNALQLDKTVFRPAQAITVIALPLPRLINTKLKWSNR